MRVIVDIGNGKGGRRRLMWVLVLCDRNDREIKIKSGFIFRVVFRL